PDLLEKEPPRSIFTWDDLVSKFINQFFPSSKITNPRNEITNFQQRFDESFSEACDRFKDLLRACPYYDKMPCECLAIVESKSKVRYSCNKPVVAKVSMNTSTSAPVKVVEESYVTCGGAHSYCNCPATDGNVYRDNIQEFVSQASAVNYNQGNTSYRPPMMNNQNRFNPNQNRGNNFNQGLVYQPSVFQPPAYQAPAYQAPAPQTQGVSKEDFSAYVKANDAAMRNMQTQGQNMQNQLTNLTDLITKFVNYNSASTSSSITLLSNIIANSRSDLKAITTLSGVIYGGPQILPSTFFLSKVVENEPEVTKDTVNPTNNGSTEDVQPQEVQSESPVLTSKPVTSPISEPAIALLSEMARTSLNEHRSVVLIKKLVEKLGDPGKFLIPCDFPGMAGARINLMPFSMWKRVYLPYLTPTCMTLELADRSISCPVGVVEDVYVKEVLGFFDTISSGNPTPFYDLIISMTSPTLTPFKNSDFLLEEVDAFLAIEDEPTSSKFYQPYLDPEGDIYNNL
nr:reverse transcriptase domain-containing protein [Tanacetum cinerariifolium]GEZ77965.1 reverse transcriptase domain-containing protein [Tanacetum cinerariifolium]